MLKITHSFDLINVGEAEWGSPDLLVLDRIKFEIKNNHLSSIEYRG